MPNAKACRQSNPSVLSGQNAADGGIPPVEPEERLYSERAEQLGPQEEGRGRVEGKAPLPPRSVLLRPRRHDPAYRYRASLNRLK